MEELKSRKRGDGEDKTLLELFTGFNILLRLPSLKSLMKSPERGCDTGTATIMALDMLFAGIDTSSHTIAFALYHLAKNPRVQVDLAEYKNSRQETIPISGSTS